MKAPTRTNSILIAATALLVFAGCGGQKSGNATTYSSASRGSQSNGGMAQAPIDLNCGAVRPVWVNMRTHVYHESSDPYYGRTKDGKYLCPNQATAEGDRASRHGGMSSQTNSNYSGQSGSNGYDNSGTNGTATGRRHHRHKERYR